MRRLSGLTELPWRKPPREALLLTLVALVALSPIYGVSSQDVSRLCLSRSLPTLHLTIGRCAGNTFDRARFAGRTYSDKAPGESLIAAPVVAVTRLGPATEWSANRDVRLWAIRLLTDGVAFVLLLWLFGRVAEGLAPGSGPLATVVLGLGTIVGALAATTFGHVVAAALAFGAFVSAWRRRWVAAGLLAGFSAVVAYEAAIVAVVLGAYAAARGWKAAWTYLLAVVPGLAFLAGYNDVAFGSPLHLSYRYVSNRFAHDQAKGLFGIGLPRWHSVARVLVTDRGLLVTSPAMLAAGVGLMLLWRTHRAEALACAAIVTGFLFLEFGYFLPYGGTSPGPRFLVPALPFLALGIPPAFARYPRAVTLLAIPSVVAGVATELTWSRAGSNDQHRTIWGELATALAGRPAHLRDSLTGNVLSFAGASASVAAVLVAGLAALALTIALGNGARAPDRPRAG